MADSKRLNGRFRSGPSYDHPAVSGSPIVELHPREFVVALFHELRPLMRGLGSRAPLRRQTITSRVYAFEGCITTASLPRTEFSPSSFNKHRCRRRRCHRRRRRRRRCHRRRRRRRPRPRRRLALSATNALRASIIPRRISSVGYVRARSV